MIPKDRIFLSVEQATKAIGIDLKRYAPQLMLCRELLRLIVDGRIVFQKDQTKDGLWVQLAGHRTMQWMDGPALVGCVCDLLAQADWSPETLAPLCARVFQTRAYPAVDPDSGVWGVGIETGMEAFKCRQCGQCCQSLDYHNEVTAEDVKLWQAMARHDILRWVAVSQTRDDETSYRIWVIPGTRQLARPCPFLRNLPSEGRWVCRIHDVKPGICRQYPVSRKHARMTGCPGFDNAVKRG